MVVYFGLAEGVFV